MDQALFVFVTVADKGSFTRTAEELHMTQPAVSQYIAALERTTGTKLLERTNKYVRLTKAGYIVYHHAKEIIGQYTRMQALIDDLMHIASGPISIGASYTFGEYVLPHAIARLSERYPLIQPTITIGNTREIAEAILNHEIDVGIIEGEYEDKKLLIEPFAEDVMEIVVAKNHRLSSEEDIAARALESETWIVRETGSGTREAADRMFSGLRLHPRKLMEFGSTQIIKESVEAGLGITLLSQWAIRKESALGTLRTIRVKGTPITRQFSLVTGATPFHTKAAQLFIELLRETRWTASTEL
ncbi:LysR family transcriptional regulator [Paenibacillus oenotherae]|uniref:LysR family transcriptional regulator n=1 Tax=Paenibacillus oenotherae TaxID=1435645 RepID=A0ABS7D9F5_9BACL|nr:LysR family transcriptional regulator [Paenibacillus oenotherae]